MGGGCASPHPEPAGKWTGRPRWDREGEYTYPAKGLHTPPVPGDSRRPTSLAPLPAPRCSGDTVPVLGQQQPRGSSPRAAEPKHETGWP